MASFLIQRTESSPMIEFRSDERTMFISGYSYPENPLEFYEPLMDWVRNILPSITGSVEIIFDIEFLNTTSIRIYLNMLKEIQNYINDGKTIVLKWLYNLDNDMGQENGTFFKNMLDVPFLLIDKNQRLTK